MEQLYLILDVAGGTIKSKDCNYIKKKISKSKCTVFIDRIYDETLTLKQLQKEIQRPKEIYIKYDIWEFLERVPVQFDLIRCFRFLEHVPMDKLLTFIYLLRSKCKTGGYCQILVPDWNRLRRIDIDEDAELITRDYLRLVYELCSSPEDPHASVFTPKKLKQFFEVEGGWKQIISEENINFAGRDIYLRSVFKAI